MTLVRTYIVADRLSLKLEVATFFFIWKSLYFLKLSLGLGLFKSKFHKKP